MSNKMKILIVDDDPDISNMLQLMLEFKGYTVTLLNEGKNIIDTLASGSYRLIILDILLTGPNGDELCRQIKKDDRFSSIPVLMFSAMPDGKQIAMGAGADDFIEKPFEMEHILEKVRSLTEIAAE
jgi:DNA-binding response OmpR family regulator